MPTLEIHTAFGSTYAFRPGPDAGAPVLLLLHGTGGDERDLLPLADEILPGATLLSPRGNVLENGMPRFFRRLAEGVFDEDDVRVRAQELAAFAAAACAHHGITRAPIAVGYSNGANIAAAVLLLHPAALGGAVLLRVMSPLREPPVLPLPGTPILMVSGASDPILPLDNARHLAKQFVARGANVRHEVVQAPHQLAAQDLEFAREFLLAQKAPA